MARLYGDKSTDASGADFSAGYKFGLYGCPIVGRRGHFGV
jgi:hypothetical protein